MTTKRESESIFLVKSHTVFNNELSMRISLGQNLYARQVNTVNDLEYFINDYESWNDYNIELIKRAFNNHKSQYYNDYKSVNFKV